MESKDLYYKRVFLEDRGTVVLEASVVEYQIIQDQRNIDIMFTISDGRDTIGIVNLGYNLSDDMQTVAELKVIANTISELISVVEKYHATE